jgi:hypothetical protein
MKKSNKTNIIPALVNNNARLATCPQGAYNVSYPAQNMNVYTTNYADAVELFNLVNIAGLEVAELRALGFGW